MLIDLLEDKLSEAGIKELIVVINKLVEIETARKYSKDEKNGKIFTFASRYGGY